MSETNNQPADNAAPAPASAPAAAAKSNTPMMVGVLLVLLVLIAAGVGAFLMMKDSDSKNKDDEKSESRDEDEEEEEEDEEENEDEDSRDEDEDEARNDSNSDICELLTQDEAEDLLGASVLEGEEDETSCTYTIDSVQSFGVLYYSVNEESFGTSAEDQYEAARDSLYSDAEEVDVDGADEAVWSEGWFQLSVLKDDKWIIVSVVSSAEGENADMDLSIEAAEIIVDRL